MRNFDEQLKKAKGVSLSHSEKSDMREKLSEYVSIKPVRAASASPASGGFSFSLLHVRFVPATLIALLVLVSGGGVAFAAEQALPGDTLYPIKVGVNEEVRAALTFGAEAKTDWELERVERRLSEVAELEERGTLTGENALLLATKIDEHSRSAKEIEKDDDDSRVVLTARLDAILNAYASTLALHSQGRGLASGEESVNVKAATQASETRMMATQNTGAEISTLSVTEDAIQVLPALLPEQPQIVVSEKAAARLLFIAEKQWKEIQRRDDADQSRVGRQLVEIDARIATAQRLFAEGMYQDSFRESRVALELIARTRVYLKGDYTEEDPATDLPAQDVPVSGGGSVDTKPDQAGAMKLLVKHEFKEGIHYLSGSLSVPTPCHELKNRIAIAESFPEQVFVEFYTETSAEACIQVIAEKEFSLQVKVSESARFSGRYNDAPVVFVFSGSANSSSSSTEDNSTETQPAPDEPDESTSKSGTNLTPRSILDDINPLR